VSSGVDELKKRVELRAILGRLQSNRPARET